MVIEAPPVAILDDREPWVGDRVSGYAANNKIVLCEFVF